MEFFAKTNHKLTENSTKVTVSGSSYFQNAFGNVVIASNSEETHCWQFKILRNKESYGIDIGVVDDSALELNHTFTSKGCGYGLCSNGNIYSANCLKNNHKIKNVKQQYSRNDIILMKLDLFHQTLSFVIDNNENQTLIQIADICVDKKISYRMAVYLSQKKDSIKLLGHTATNIIEVSAKHEQKQMISKLQHEYKRVQKQMDSALQKIKIVQKENNALSQQIKAQKETLHITNATRVELETAMRSKDDKLDKLQEELKKMNKIYNQQKEEKQMFDELQHKYKIMENENNAQKKEMNSLQTALKQKNNEWIQAQKTIKIMQNEIENQKLQIQTKQESLNETLRIKENVFDELKREINSMKHEYKLIEDKYNAVQNSVKDKENQLLQSQNKINILNKENEALLQQIKTQKESLNVTNLAKLELEAIAETKQNEILLMDKLRDELLNIKQVLQEREEEMEQLERKKGNKYKDNPLLIERIDKLETENRRIKRMKENMKNKMSEKEMNIFRLTQQNDEYKESNKRQQSRILSVKKENQSLRNNRDQTQRINLKQRKEIGALRKEIDQLKVYKLMQM